VWQPPPRGLGATTHMVPDQAEDGPTPQFSRSTTTATFVRRRRAPCAVMGRSSDDGPAWSANFGGVVARTESSGASGLPMRVVPLSPTGSVRWSWPFGAGTFGGSRPPGNSGAFRLSPRRGPLRFSTRLTCGNAQPHVSVHPTRMGHVWYLAELCARAVRAASRLLVLAASSSAVEFARGRVAPFDHRLLIDPPRRRRRGSGGPRRDGR
jgi:hypothetical protein